LKGGWQSMNGEEHSSVAADASAFPRLLEGDFSSDEVAAVNAAMATNPALRAEFIEYGSQAVGIAEHLRSSAEPLHRAPSSPNRAWRIMPWFVGVAASVVVGVFALRQIVTEQPAIAQVISVEGDCWRAQAGAEAFCRVGDSLKSGDTLRTSGTSGNTMVQFKDGTRVVLIGDTAVTLAVSPESGKFVRVHSGQVSAEVTPQPTNRPLQVETPDALVEVVGTSLTVSCPVGRTSVGVSRGEVRVTDRSRNDTVTVRAGESATVSAEAAVTPRPRPNLPASWMVDFSAGPPRGWKPGLSTEVAGRKGIRAGSVWLRQHGKEHYQVVSPNAWCYGLFAFDREAFLTVDLRLERPGPVQAILVVRDDPPGTGPCSQVYIHDDIAAGKPAGEWHTVRVPLGEFRSRFNLPAHARPAAFLALFDTLDQDLGLTVSRIHAGQP